MTVGLSVSVCGRVYGSILSGFEVVFECDSVFIFIGYYSRADVWR